jgi:hypothetical protein
LIQPQAQWWVILFDHIGIVVVGVDERLQRLADLDAVASVQQPRVTMMAVVDEPVFWSLQFAGPKPCERIPSLPTSSRFLRRLFQRQAAQSIRHVRVSKRVSGCLTA